jgi:putative ABC transport system permease protein
MSYALATIWHERHRYLPGILAVAFSALLVSMQVGLLMGLFSITSMPIDRTPQTHIWMGGPEVEAVDVGRPIRENNLTRLASAPEIEQAEIYLQGFAYWAKRSGSATLCMVIGSRLADDALGAVNALTREHRDALTEFGTIVIDKSDMKRLSVQKIGDIAEVSGHRVKVVGFTKGVLSLAGPYVFCSIPTSRALLRVNSDQCTYILGRCKNPADTNKVVQRMREEYKNVTTYGAWGFSFWSQWHWIWKTKAGIALLYAAAMGVLVGAIVTSQTLHAATAASLREFAVLRALGIPKWRMERMVMTQAFVVGMIGVLLSLPAVHLAAYGATLAGVQILLPWWLLLASTALTLTMAIGSGVMALRKLREAEPAALLR